MANYIRMAIVANCLDQEIVNVFYYAYDGINDAAALSAANRLAVGEDWLSNHAADWLAGQYDQYELTELQVSAVDQGGAVVSDYTVVVPASGAGVQGGPADSLGLCAIIGFQCSYPFANATAGVRVTKKSYIAYGPLVSALIDNDGALLMSAPLKTAIASSITATVVGDTGDFFPIRVGVVGPVSGETALGKVDSVIFRPYARPRKSRMKRANGR